MASPLTDQDFVFLSNSPTHPLEPEHDHYHSDIDDNDEETALEEDFFRIETNTGKTPPEVYATATDLPWTINANYILKYLPGAFLTIKRYLSGFWQGCRLDTLLPAEAHLQRKYAYTVRRLVDYQGFQLKSSDVINIFELLQSKHPRSFDLVKELFVTPPETIENRKPSNRIALWLRENAPKHFLFVPFQYPGHIVIITIDFVDKKVEYYDSNGYPSSSPYYRYDDFDMHQELENIFQTCFPNQPTAICDNSTVHQFDAHNCGIYICDYAERRLCGKTFNDIVTHGKSADLIETKRVAFALAFCKGT